jgi:hypothetical protein
VTIPAHSYGEVPARARVGYTEIRDVWASIADLITGKPRGGADGPAARARLSTRFAK